MSQTPKTMRAVVQNEGDDRTISVKDHPVPSLGPNEVLIKVAYAAQNPTDWKHSAYFSPPGAALGCDFSGTIAALGPSLVNPTLKIGDQVAGCVHGNLWGEKGSFAEYCKQESDLVFGVPEGMGMEEAATFGVAWVTACQVLVEDQNVAWPPASQNGKYYLVYGASSSVGLFALPLAKAMGYKTIAVCSPHSFDLVRKYGADEVVDYHLGVEAVGAEIKRLSGGGVDIGLDTISEEGSIRIAQAGFAEKGGRLNLILPAPKGMEGRREEVEVSNTMMYTLFGKRFSMTPDKPDAFWFEASEKDRKFGADIMVHTPELIKEYGIKGNPVEIRGGLEAVAQGYKDMKDGKVSGKKFVYKVAA